MGRAIQQLRRYLLDRMVLRPSRDELDHRPKQRVWLTSAGRPLECFVEETRNDDDQPVDVLVLKFPGTAGRAERASNFPLDWLPIEPEQRVSIWTWNPPGYGGSAGRASLGRIAEASLDFWDRVTTKKLAESTRVLLCGNSLGCVTALHVASKVDHQRSGLILRNPPPLIPVVKHVASRYPMSRLVNPIAESLCDRMNATVTAKSVEMPAVFMQCELDSLVLPEFQEQVIDAFAGPKRIALLKGLDHADVTMDEHEEIVRESIHWLWETVSK